MHQDEDAFDVKQRVKKPRRRHRPPVFVSPFADILDKLGDAELLHRTLSLLDPRDLLALARTRCVHLAMSLRQSRRTLRVCPATLTDSLSKRMYAIVMDRRRELFEAAFARLDRSEDPPPACPASSMTLPQWTAMLWPEVCTVSPDGCDARLAPPCAASSDYLTRDAVLRHRRPQKVRPRCTVADRPWRHDVLRLQEGWVRVVAASSVDDAASLSKTVLVSMLRRITASPACRKLCQGSISAPLSARTIKSAGYPGEIQGRATRSLCIAGTPCCVLPPMCGRSSTMRRTRMLLKPRWPP